MEQPAKTIAPFHNDCWRSHESVDLRSAVRRCEVQAAVRPKTIVMIDEDGQQALWLPNIPSGKSIDVAVAARHSKGDARRLQDSPRGAGGSGNAYGPGARDACPAPPARRSRAFASALSPD